MDLGKTFLQGWILLDVECTFPVPLRSFTLKKNNIGIVVSEILGNTYTQTNILLLLYKENIKLPSKKRKKVCFDFNSVNCPNEMSFKLNYQNYQRWVIS